MVSAPKPSEIEGIFAFKKLSSIGKKKKNVYRFKLTSGLVTDWFSRDELGSTLKKQLKKLKTIFDEKQNNVTIEEQTVTSQESNLLEETIEKQSEIVQDKYDHPMETNVESEDGEKNRSNDISLPEEISITTQNKDKERAIREEDVLDTPPSNVYFEKENFLQGDRVFMMSNGVVVGEGIIDSKINESLFFVKIIKKIDISDYYLMQYEINQMCSWECNNLKKVEDKLLEKVESPKETERHSPVDIISNETNAFSSPQILSTPAEMQFLRNMFKGIQRAEVIKTDVLALKSFTQRPKNISNSDFKKLYDELYYSKKNKYYNFDSHDSGRSSRQNASIKFSVKCYCKLKDFKLYEVSDKERNNGQFEQVFNWFCDYHYIFALTQEGINSVEDSKKSILLRNKVQKILRDLYYDKRNKGRDFQKAMMNRYKKMKIPFEFE